MKIKLIDQNFHRAPLTYNTNGPSERGVQTADCIHLMLLKLESVLLHSSNTSRMPRSISRHNPLDKEKERGVADRKPGQSRRSSANSSIE
mmetsp:Transcript_10250/g.19379  ORF Transcript_10250/g.19379 Transcript_10250/m.19379 type:complete len:90 (+) Transcript_10250:39-308(+)